MTRFFTALAVAHGVLSLLEYEGREAPPEAASVDSAGAPPRLAYW